MTLLPPPPAWTYCTNIPSVSARSAKQLGSYVTGIMARRLRMEYLSGNKDPHCGIRQSVLSVFQNFI
jgi:hypothetical protein